MSYQTYASQRRALEFLFPLDLQSAAFERAQARIPARAYPCAVDASYTFFRVASARQGGGVYAVRLLRRGLNEFASGCTCPAGASRMTCWHIAACFRVAALMNGWPERDLARWQRLYEAAMEAGRLADAEMFAIKLLACGGDRPPVKQGATVSAETKADNKKGQARRTLRAAA